ncbi:MAG: 1-acyl-sn-glycerol-3-phosphate acyltransferase [Lachnoclostridium sp.]|nr:1-acyl-sn-glycerol-3-phosphate acyltransferase [Lachnoclostridium sp.]
MLFNKRAAQLMAMLVMRLAFKALLWVAGAKKTIIGREHLLRDRSVLYAANHRSFYDILLAYSEVPSRTLFIAKSGLKKYIIVAQWMYILQCLFINREDMKQQMRVIMKATERAKEGSSVYIAPEGKRNASDELLSFKEGSFRIAKKAGCPIIPVCIVGTEELFEKAIPWLRKGKILIEFGKPVYLDKLEPEQQKYVGAYIQGIVADMYQKNKLLVKGEKA